MGLKPMKMEDLPKIEPVFNTNPEMEDIPEVKEETVNIDLGGLEITEDTPDDPQAAIKLTIMSKIILSDPRLDNLPTLLLLFVEIMMYRLHGKKNKVGILKATVNQISCAVEISQEEVDEWNNLQM